MPYKDPAKQRAAQVRLTLERKAVAQQYILAYLRNHPCADCAEDDPVVLEFDHVRGVKRRAISRLVQQGYVIGVIQAEIDKCEVVCANCHRRRTYGRLPNVYKLEAVV